jgi:hypothetical protein
LGFTADVQFDGQCTFWTERSRQRMHAVCIDVRKDDTSPELDEHLGFSRPLSIGRAGNNGNFAVESNHDELP